MIIGDASIFAIESRITQIFGGQGYRALGSFVLHIGGRRYGVQAEDATIMSCSLVRIEQRLANRGKHTVPFGTEPDATRIAYAFRSALYAEEQEVAYFGIPVTAFCDMIRSSRIMWAPDGDEAFDDGSYVLQFDVACRVRLIAFMHGDRRLFEPATLSDIWLAENEYYQVLQEWRKAFVTECIRRCPPGITA